jgi:hypothetical protein
MSCIDPSLRIATKPLKVGPLLLFSISLGATYYRGPDQDPLYPSSRGPRTDMSRPGIEPGPPAWEASTLEKNHLDSIFAGYSEPLLGLRPALHPGLYTIFFICAAGGVWKGPGATVPGRHEGRRGTGDLLY